MSHEPTCASPHATIVSLWRAFLLDYGEPQSSGSTSGVTQFTVRLNCPTLPTGKIGSVPVISCRSRPSWGTEIEEADSHREIGRLVRRDRPDLRPARLRRSLERSHARRLGLRILGNAHNRSELGRMYRHRAGLVQQSRARSPGAEGEPR